jgi:aspartate kinase
VIVCKFGGTSVQDAAAIRRLGDIAAARAPESPLVVVSALAKVTDGLFQLARHVAAGDLGAVDVGLAQLVERHRTIAAQLACGPAAVEPIMDDAAALLDELSDAIGRPLTARETDALVAHGELWSSRLVTAALAGRRLPAAWVDARQVIVTDGRHGRAVPNTQEVAGRAEAVIRPMLESARIPVTQGFIGATADGVTTTLGRGGSDFTAALLGAALGAERVEIWTDVDGLMTADPRIVPEARVLPAATYEEAAELATFGAKVLHPATQLPLVRERIPIVILNSSHPDRGGTTITAESPMWSEERPVRSISFKRGITVVNIRAPRMLGAFGFLRAIFEVFERHETAVDVLASGEVSVSLTIEDTSRLDAIVCDLATLGEVWTEPGRAIVAVVGVGLRHTPGLAARVFAAVPPANVDVISQGASAINMTFVVHETDGPDVVRRLHRTFFP